jgi:hypothetical protein
LSTAPTHWFGDFEIAQGQVGVWRIGPLRLQVRHAAGEWRVCHERGDDPWQADVSVRISPGEGCDEQAVERYIAADNSPRFTLQPLLPDRSLVTRPVSPVYVPADEVVRLYVSIPVWLRLAVGERQKPLTELATIRLSDTWFGPSPMNGELCYALRSRCRLALEPETLLAYRAITPLVIRNKADQALLLERVNVPVRQLSLFAEPGGQLWTSEVALERTEDGQFANLRIDADAPAEARGAEPVSGPREPLPRRTAVRAFSALFQ